MTLLSILILVSWLGTDSRLILDFFAHNTSVTIGTNQCGRQLINKYKQSETGKILFS